MWTSWELKISLDGDQFCALIGDNIQEGIVGFGYTQFDAIKELANEAELVGFDFM